MPFGLFFLALAFTGIHPAQKSPSAADILAKSQRAYDSVNSFEQVSHGTISTNTSTAHLWYSKPGKLRATGSVAFGGAGSSISYDLLINGKTVNTNTSGQWQTQQSPEMGIATVTGISMNAVMRVPSLLFHISWGSFKASMQAPLTMRSDTLHGVPTYAVTSSGEMKTTIWFDKKSYFIVKTSSAVMKNTITVTFDQPAVNKTISPRHFQK